MRITLAVGCRHGDYDDKVDDCVRSQPRALHRARGIQSGPVAGDDFLCSYLLTTELELKLREPCAAACRAWYRKAYAAGLAFRSNETALSRYCIDMSKLQTPPSKNKKLPHKDGIDRTMLAPVSVIL